MAEQIARVKPRLRGVSHEYAFFVSLATGAALILIADGSRARMAAAVYAAAMTALFGCSALYHRPNWSAPVRRWMRRLDHSSIFLLIAGTFTPFALLALKGTLATAILIVVWAAALSGIVLKMAWIDAPRWLTATVFVALGWVGVFAMPQLWDALGPAAVLLLATGGVLYTVGAVIYARKRPDPKPAVFGYHEIFHLLVIGAAALHYSVIALFVLPA
ncbi:MAG: hemolysin III family protein [Solirubrobacterales bacterium]